MIEPRVSPIPLSPNREGTGNANWVDSVHEREELVGYNVIYEYRGKVFETRTVAHPGKWMDVEVHLEPAGKYAANQY